MMPMPTFPARAAGWLRRSGRNIAATVTNTSRQPAPHPAACNWCRALSLFMFGALASGCVTSDAAGSIDDLFVQQEIIGIPDRATVLTGFFLGGATAEIAIVHVDRNDTPYLTLYRLDDNAWTEAHRATLKRGVLLVDVARIGGRDRLLVYRRGRMNWFDPDSASEHLLVDLVSRFRRTDHGSIPRVDVTRDLNHDGRDDLLIPDVDGFRVAIQLGDSSFAEVVTLGPPEPYRDETIGNLDAGDRVSNPARTYGEIGITTSTLPLYLSRVHEMDYDLDGRSDLVFWNEDHFIVYRQDEKGLFGPRARAFAPGVAFDSDGVYSHAFEFKDQGVFGMLLGVGGKTRTTVLHSLRDLNRDGVPDLVTLTLSGRSFAKQRSVYEVYFGAPSSDGVVFEGDAGTTINPSGKAGGMQPWGYSSQTFRDFDGDGQMDIMFRDVNVGFGGMGRALVGNSVPVNLEFYRGENGVYPERPTARRSIKRFAPLAGLGNVYFPVVLPGDVNGDGRSDLLVGQSPDELHVFFGVPGPDLLAREPHRVAVSLPYDERNILLVDLNKDDRQDLLIQLAPAGRGPDSPHRLITLIAR